MKEYKSLQFKHPYNSIDVEKELNIHAKDGYVFKFHQVYCDESFIIVMERDVITEVEYEEIPLSKEDVIISEIDIKERMNNYGKYKCTKGAIAHIECKSCTSEKLEECKIYSSCSKCPCNKCLKCEFFMKVK